MNGIQKQKLSTYSSLIQVEGIVTFVGFIYLLIFAVTLLILPKTAHAQFLGDDAVMNETACVKSDNYIETYFDLDQGTYTLKIEGNLDHISQMYFTDESKSCQQINMAESNEIMIKSSGLHMVQFYLTDMYSSDTKPTLTFVSKDDADVSGCQSRDGCPFEYDKELLMLYPKRISSYFDNAEVYIYESLDTAKVSSVKYAVNSKVVYEQDRLEPFNKNFVPPGDQTLQTKIEFSNGLYAVKTEAVKTGTFADLFILARSWFYQNSYVVLYPLVLLVFIAIFISIQKFRVWRHERKLWRTEHLANSDETQELLTEGHIITSETDETLQFVGHTIKKPFIAVVCLMLLVTLSARFGLTLVRTDGESMLQTLQNNQQMLVNRGGRALASVRRANYIPHRGDIVIFERTSEGAVGEKSLLVKRVLGLPGDKIEVQDEKIVVHYNQDGKEKEYIDSDQKWFETANKSLFNGRIKVTLGVGELFVVGDNRDGSIDSRIFGPIKAESVYGKVVKRL